jgi:hypothetical protein
VHRPSTSRPSADAHNLLAKQFRALLPGDVELRGQHPPRIDETTGRRLTQHRRV